VFKISSLLSRDDSVPVGVDKHINLEILKLSLYTGEGEEETTDSVIVELLVSIVVLFDTSPYAGSTSVLG
jgi:hypothetical protein